MPRVILVDDEQLARQGIRELLAAHPEIEIVGEAGGVADAAELIRKENPDAVFLDIRMPGADGFELLRAVDPAPPVVFMTAHADHAARAFEVQAVDYVLKPVKPQRLAEAVLRLLAACSQPAGEGPRYNHADRLCLRTPERTTVTSLDHVSALEANGDFTRFHIDGQPPLLICQMLGSYEKTLPAPPFARISRSLIVNLDRITRVERSSREEAGLWLRGVGKPFPIGPSAQSRLKEHGF